MNKQKKNTKFSYWLKFREEWHIMSGAHLKQEWWDTQIL